MQAGAVPACKRNGGMIMAAFRALNFSFDGKSSKDFGVKIVHIDESGWMNDSIGAAFEAVLSEHPLRQKQRVYGVDMSECMEFSITIGSLKPLDRFEVRKIAAWLFARRKPCRLYIHQSDMAGVYYECFLTNPEQVSRGNLPYAFNCTVKCTSPFAWKDTSISGIKVEDSKTFTIINNGADADGYVAPIIKMSIQPETQTVKIENSANAGSCFELDFSEDVIASDGEVITVDNDNQIISSSAGINRLECFNKKWFKIKHGANNITITGKGTYDFSYSIPYIIGA